MHLYTDGGHYISAETFDEAYELRQHELGVAREDGRVLVQVEDDAQLRAWVDRDGKVTDEDEPGGLVVGRSAAQWAADCKGHVFSTER